jgi:hypothetical protein
MRQRRKLLRAANILKAALLTYREAVYDIDLTKADFQDGILHLYQNQENESLVYEMSIVVQPPLEAQPNVKLFPPFILRVQIRDKSTSEAIPAEEQLSRIWAIVSPVDEDNRNTSSSPSAFVSNGRLCDSPHPLHDSDISSLLIFQDVAFREPGKYKIRATLVRMEGNAALNWLQLESHPIHIRDGAESSVGCKSSIG